MQTCVNINGTITTADKATISIFDHGFLFGDSVYEAFRTQGGRLFLFSRHFERLERSARGIYLTIPWTKDRIRSEIQRTIEASGNPECKVRLLVTRGTGDIIADPSVCSNPTVVIIVSPLPEFPQEMYEKGVQLTVSSIKRGGMVADFKTGNLMHQVLATREAKSRGAYDAILLTIDGYLSDGIACNVFMVQGNVLRTPGTQASIVEGITKGVILGVARTAGMEVVEGLFRPDQIGQATEMFLSSTYRELVPIVRVDGETIGDGRPGPWTKKLIAAYQQAVDKLAAED